MKFGLMIEGQEGLTWERWRRLARAAEDLGIDSLRRSDHFFSLAGQTRQPSLETWVALTVAALETKRVQIGPLVCSMTFRHPALLARMAAQVDVLSGGRLELGVGAGWNAAEHEAFGIRLPQVKERMDRLEEGILVIRALLENDVASFDGEHYQLKDATCLPKPAQSPLPLLIGGTGERRTLRLVAEHAQHWNAVSINMRDYPKKIAALERHCADVGRDPKEIKRSRMAGFVIGRDREEQARHLERVAPSVRYLAGLDFDRALPAIREHGWVVGTPGEIVEQVQEMADAGIEEFMAQHHAQDDFATLELFASEVMERFG